MNAVTEIVADREVSENYKYFKQMKPEWSNDHLADYALLHHQQLVAFFDDEDDAIDKGIRDYGMGNFSVQPVRDLPVDLGWQGFKIFGFGRQSNYVN